MCGIAGLYSSNPSFSKDHLLKMLDVIRHRGPDNQGVYCNHSVGLGHQRLSIIDTSKDAHQPMTSHCGRYVISYNGEVYNFKELAKNLSVPLKTHSDTEVVLELFAQLGSQCIRQFNGMFSAAIYDTKENTLYPFRDRAGIKPLYYYFDEHHFVFSSELKALTALPYIKQHIQLDIEAIHQYLNLGFIPEPLTIYKHIYKFPAAHYAKIQTNASVVNIQFENYWSVENEILREPIHNENQAKEELHSLLKESVKRHLISDVPYGVLLSGGTDSSLLAALAQAMNQKPIKTFTIGFNHGKYDESNHAKNVADFLKTEHYSHYVDETEIKKLIPSLCSIYDEPFGDSSALPTLLLSQYAKQHATMVLSGDGGDELFMGYGRYRLANYLHKPIIQALHKPLAVFLSLSSSARYQKASSLLDFEHTLTSEHIFSQEQSFFSKKEIAKILIKEQQETHSLKNLSTTQRLLFPAEEQSIFDFRYYLKDDLLVKIDRASMHHSLEVRVPLLDNSIISYSLNLDHRLKNKNNINKYLLKEIAYEYIPKHLLDRPKQGFAIPLQHWLKNDLRFLINNYLSDSHINKHGIFDPTLVNKLTTQFLYNKKDHLYHKIWLLIVLQQFLEKLDS